MENKEFALSASRVITYLKCSMVYYCENVLKIDGGGNFGSKRGSICHDIFEILIKPKNKDRVARILELNTVQHDVALVRLIRLKMRQYALDEFDDKDQHNYTMICDMVYVGLCSDFYCGDWDIDYNNLEKKFTLRNDNPEYVLRGLIDKPSSKDGQYRIVDYKSSQSKKTESELQFDIQALSYILFAKKELQMDAFVEFVFLRFPDNPYCIVDKPKKELLIGFEQFLSDLYFKLKNFTWADAQENYAYDKGYPKDGTFGGQLMCGYSKFKGHCYSDTHKDKTKRGKPYYSCPFKWDFIYYSLLDKQGNIIKSSINKSDLDDSLGTIETRYWEGCPRWQTD